MKEYTLRRYVNLLREADRTARVTPILYPVVFVWTTMLLTPFYITEPDVFDYSDHV